MKTPRMRVVIDSNMLESEELREFLSVSSENRAVLTGYAWLEAYRHDPVNSIVKRLSILSEFPGQVDVLEGARTIARIDPSLPAIEARMIRTDSNFLFKQTITALSQSVLEDHVIEQIMRHGVSAQEQSQDMILGVPDILTALPEMQDQMFSAVEVKRCRTGQAFTPEMIGSILSAADQLGETL